MWLTGSMMTPCFLSINAGEDHLKTEHRFGYRSRLIRFILFQRKKSTVTSHSHPHCYSTCTSPLCKLHWRPELWSTTKKCQKLVFYMLYCDTAYTAVVRYCLVYNCLFKCFHAYIAIITRLCTFYAFQILQKFWPWCFFFLSVRNWMIKLRPLSTYLLQQ